MANLNSKVIVVVPCFNEEDRLPVQKFLDSGLDPKEFGFLFVDDGSNDKTFEILKNVVSKKPNQFQILQLELNSGKAEAVRQGFLKAFELKAEYVAYWDADLATPLETLPILLDILRQRPQLEMVIGSRVNLLGRDVRRNLFRHYLGRVFATFVAITLRMGIYDTQCGAKIFRNTETLKKIFSDPFKSGWIFDVELIARYLKEKKVAGRQAAGQFIYEFPLTVWHDIPGSKVKFSDFPRAAFELIRIFLLYR